MSGCEIPTMPIISMVRSCASFLDTLSCTSSASAIWLPMVWMGLKEVIGSWKIMLISFPRTSRSCLALTG